MKFKIRIVFIFLNLLFLCGYNLYSQFDPNRLYIRNISLNQGLSQCVVTDLIEDNNGFLLFGIASDKNFITDELVSEIDSFKLRLQRFKYKCGENTIKYKRNIVPWMEYLYFYISRN